VRPGPSSRSDGSGVARSAPSELKPGDKFAVRGPYGNGFSMEDYYGKNLVFVAGGIGLIPCAPASSMRSSTATNTSASRSLRLQDTEGIDVLPNLQGVATVGRCRVLPHGGPTADSWTGNVGVVGSLFKKPGVQVPVENTIAFVCGPPIMFRFVIKDLLAMGFQERDIVSTLERYMKCGVGKCGHCCIGVAYVCVDGPVFTYEQIKKLGEDI
jgi:sulfhydrogenase subunit gamma (sulfur reductase)